MQSVAHSRGGECLSPKYLGMQKKLRWRCAHGHEWDTTPAVVVQSGCWCPECSSGLGERLTRAALEHLMGAPFPRCRPDWLYSERGTSLELDGYNPTLNIAFEHQGDQHFSEIAYFANKETFQQRLLDDQRKRELCESRGVALIEIPQVSKKIKVADLGSFIEHSLLNLGVDVPRKGTQPDYRDAYRTSGSYAFLKRLHEIARAKGGECLEQHYMGSRAEHRFRCANGHEWMADADRVLRGRWCIRCANAKKAHKHRHTIEHIQNAAIQRGGKLLSKEYHRANERLLWECLKGHQWEAKYNTVRDGSWCPRCARYSTEELQQVASSRGGNFLSRECLGVNKHHEWQCSLGHRWSAKLANVLRGTWCPECAANRPLDINEMREIAANRGGECLSDLYKNAKSKLVWRCHRGHEWQAVPFSVKNNGTWCPQCWKSSHKAIKEEQRKNPSKKPARSFAETETKLQ